MPSYDRVRLNKHQRRTPVSPDLGQSDPKQPVAGPEMRPLGCPFQRAELLPQRQVLQGQFAMSAASHCQRTADQERQLHHTWILANVGAKIDSHRVRIEFWRTSEALKHQFAMAAAGEGEPACDPEKCYQHTVIVSSVWCENQRDTSPDAVLARDRRPVPSRPGSSQPWCTFLRNHACETLTCDVFVAVTATFRLVYVFLLREIGTRRILHWNVTEHPTGEWPAQQFRSVLTGEEPYWFVVHDRDAVFSLTLDNVVQSMKLRVLEDPCPRSAGERVLRTPDRNRASRMPRPSHSAE